MVAFNSKFMIIFLMVIIFSDDAYSALEDGQPYTRSFSQQPRGLFANRTPTFQQQDLMPSRDQIAAEEPYTRSFSQQPRGLFANRSPTFQQQDLMPSRDQIAAGVWGRPSEYNDRWNASVQPQPIEYEQPSRGLFNQPIQEQPRRDAQQVFRLTPVQTPAQPSAVQYTPDLSSIINRIPKRPVQIPTEVIQQPRRVMDFGSFKMPSRDQIAAGVWGRPSEYNDRWNASVQPQPIEYDDTFEKSAVDLSDALDIPTKFIVPPHQQLQWEKLKPKKSKPSQIEIGMQNLIAEKGYQGVPIYIPQYQTPVGEEPLYQSEYQPAGYLQSPQQQVGTNPNILDNTNLDSPAEFTLADQVTAPVMGSLDPKSEAESKMYYKRQLQSLLTNAPAQPSLMRRENTGYGFVSGRNKAMKEMFELIKTIKIMDNHQPEGNVDTNSIKEIEAAYSPESQMVKECLNRLKDIGFTDPNMEVTKAFKNAFNTLTLENFVNESITDFGKGFFFHLFDNSGLNLDNIDSPFDWCAKATDTDKCRVQIYKSKLLGRTKKASVMNAYLHFAIYLKPITLEYVLNYNEYVFDNLKFENPTAQIPIDYCVTVSKIYPYVRV